MRTSILIILIFLSVQIKAQPSHGKGAYIDFIKKFYYHLLEDDTVTVKETTEMFGLSSIEYEAYLFNVICDKDPNNKICKERGINPIANEWGDYTSIFFKELKKCKEKFTLNYDSVIDSVVLCRGYLYDEDRKGIISLDIHFPEGKVIYFNLNKYPDEPIYIADIYFEDGVNFYSLFDKYISPEDKEGSVDYLQRLAIVNDPDGYTNVRKDRGAEYPIVGKILADEIFMFTPNYYEDWWKVSNKDETIVGYMHKSRIVPFGNLSEEKEERI